MKELKYFINSRVQFPKENSNYSIKHWKKTKYNQIVLMLNKTSNLI